MNTSTPSRPKVSVVIPAYNSLVYLPATVESVLNQSFQDFEVLVVNDGSTDGTREWVRQVRDPRVRLIDQANQGLSGARNSGIREAHGEYIALLDADDLWDPSKLQKQVHALEEHPTAGLAYTWTMLADAQGRPTGEVVASAEGDPWQQLVEFKTVICGGSVPLIRRTCFDQVGVFDTSLKIFEDLDVYLRIAKRYPMIGIPEPLTFYRQHSHSMSASRITIMLETFRQLVEREFLTVATDLLHLRSRGYGRVYLYVAWRSMESKDWKAAIQFSRQALAFYPSLGRSRSFLRLQLAIAFARSFSPRTYDGLRHLVHTVRRGFI